MQVRTQNSRTHLIACALAALTTLPGLALAHTGTDAGGHHNFLDALLYAFSDLSLPALVVALGVWGAIFMTSRSAKKRKQEALRRNDTPRDRQ